MGNFLQMVICTMPSMKCTCISGFFLFMHLTKLHSWLLADGVEFVRHTVNLAPAQSHIWHMLCKICFTIILCWLHMRRIWHTMCQQNCEAYLTYVKKNIFHMWLIVLHLRQLCHIVYHIWLCAGTDLQCTSKK
jgi:hypothetical protein